MPRQARIDAPGALQHLMVRGIERRKLFLDDRDRDAFVERLGGILQDAATPCSAWTLLPNHAPLLVRTGRRPLPRGMRSLLTGYAGAFNRRYHRHGHRFQNRYKSIVCQQDPYFLELVRYLHLHPLRGGLVRELAALDRYPYAGHSALRGRRENDWQDTAVVLGHFGRRVLSARQAYRAFVEAGSPRGRRPELVGGGLIRSLGGWTAVRASGRGGPRLKGDERILGDSEFVLAALAAVHEPLRRDEQLRRQGRDLAWLARQVAAVVGLPSDQIYRPSRRRPQVAARSRFCFRAVRDLGVTATSVARALGCTQPAVSIAVRRGARIAAARDVRLGSG